MKDGHRWQENDDRECYVCQKYTHCVFVWSLSLTDNGYFNKNEEVSLPVSEDLIDCDDALLSI